MQSRRVRVPLWCGRLFRLIGPVLVLAALAMAQQEPAGGGPPAQGQKLDWLSLGLELLGGLVLFLYGVSRLSEGLKAVAGDRARDLLSRFTKHRFAGVITGAVATTVLDSSSVTIIMVIALVNAGLISFENSLGVILGSNIGTTISSQLFAFDLDQYAPVMLVVGFLLYSIRPSERRKQIGMVVFGIGLVFFGLHLMGDAMEPLQKHEPFLALLRRMENPLLGALVGAGFTALIQSSSATLGIVITMASGGMITLPAGVALMLGAEVGTCADTLLATLGRHRNAVRAGVFHLVFNLFTAAVGVVFASQLAALAKMVSGGGSVGRQIANAHVLFNVLGVLLVIGFTPWIARGLKAMLPDKAEGEDGGKKEPEPDAETVADL